MIYVQKILEMTAKNRYISLEEAYDLKLIEDTVDEVILQKIDEEEIKDYKDFNVYNQYINEIKKYSILTMEEEKELFTRYKRGDELVKEKLIACNLALVVHIANMFVSPKDNPSFNIMDVIQEGNIGLMGAIEMFDVDKGCKFSTFATFVIKDSILRSLFKYGKTIRLPEHREYEYKKINRFIEEYLLKEGKKPSDEILMREFNLTKSDLYKYSILKSYVLSFDSFSSELDISIYDYIKDNSISTEDLVEGEMITEELLEVIEGLTSARNIELFKYRKGIRENMLDAKEEIPTKVLAKHYNVSQNRINQLEHKVANKMKKYYMRKFK